MEVRINKEVRSYTEAIFFGLNARQFIFSVIACIAALITYFVTGKFFNTEIVSWLCILAALPFSLEVRRYIYEYFLIILQNVVGYE